VYSTYPRHYSINTGPLSFIAIKSNQVHLCVCMRADIRRTPSSFRTDKSLPEFTCVTQHADWYVYHPIMWPDQGLESDLGSHTPFKPRLDTIQFTKHGRRRKRRRRKGGIVCHCIMTPVHDTIYSFMCDCFFCVWHSRNSNAAQLHSKMVSTAVHCGLLLPLLVKYRSTANVNRTSQIVVWKPRPTGECVMCVFYFKTSTD
jgi:hypothetical protein